jgi:hypothetical protein
VVIGLISVVAVFFLGMGLYALVAPASLIRPFGVTLSRPESRAEVRAVYGGFGLAVAGVLVYAALNPSVGPAILIAVAVALAGMAVVCASSLTAYLNAFTDSVDHEYLNHASPSKVGVLARGRRSRGAVAT